MAGEWVTTTLGDCVRFVSGGTPPKSKVSLWNGSTPWITAKDMKSFWVDDSEDMLSATGAEAATSIVPAGSTLLLVRGMTLHNDIPIVRVRRPSTFNQDVKAVLPKEGLLADYVAYLLLGNKPTLQEKVDAAGHGTGRLALDALVAIAVCLPGLSTQRRIAGLLSSLDDKIEVNRRSAETLEAMARALFKSWFVDFDPVYAKAEGRPAGLPENLATLFPDTFDEGGLPAGWERKSLSELARFLNGLALQKYPAGEDEPSLPVIKIAELRSGPTAKSGRASINLPSEYQVQDGDHLFSWSGSLTHCRWTHGAGALNQHLFKVSPFKPFPGWLVYEAVEQHLPEFQAIAAGKAVTMGHIQRHHVDEAMLAVPPSNVLQAIDAVFAPLHNRRLAADLQSRTLGELRDILLPKLISGELRIADVEAKVAAA